MAEKTIFLLDAYALAYRSYYAFIKNPRINSKGENTSAVFGFANTLLEVLNKQKPSHIGVVFDPKGPTFRHEMYPEYKAHREAMPEDMRQSIPYIKEMIEAMNIPVVEVAGFEADDVIGTLACRSAEQGFKVFMMTPDKDYAQLVTENINVYKPARGGNEVEIWTPDGVVEKFKVTPDHMIDLLGLMGDASDNIPGCPGIGPKTAESLITKYGSIEGIYEHIDDLKGKQKENLLQFKDQVALSKTLVTIETNVDIAFDADRFKVEAPDELKITELFNRLEFRNLIGRVLSTHAVTEVKPVQGSLFDIEQPQPVQPMVEIHSERFNPEKSKYHLITQIDDAQALLQKLLQQNEVCFDTETTSLEIHSAELVGFSFSFTKNEAYYISVDEDFNKAKSFVDVFRPFFLDQRILKIGQNIKYDIQVLKNYGIEVAGPFFDTMIAHYLIQPETRHNLDAMALTILNYQTIHTEELIGKKGKNQLSMRQVEVEKVKDYACEDADITLQLVPWLRKQLAESKMTDLMNLIEAPLIPVLADMEYQGVKIDHESLHTYALELNNEITTVENSIYELAGEKFNISSPKQLGDILFEKLKIMDNAQKTKTQQYATGEDVLIKLVDKHPIVSLILDYRTLKKLLSTYVEALPELIHAKTGKVHTSYNQTITATGRLSSNNPNLQNIPIREERGREIRKAFIPSDEKHILLAADYSQIELRLMAHFSQDEHMITAFNQGEDIHAATAARVFNVPSDQVTREMRSQAKGANFGIIYGISSFGLAQNLNIARKDAKSLIDNYFESYPKVKVFMDDSVKIAREKGFAETHFGRRRYLADLNSNNAIVRGAAERNAINAPIQGTAADIIKIAMIGIANRLKQEKLESKMILQVHDELVFDVLKTELDMVKDIVKQEMEAAANLSVPLTVELGEGINWLEAH